MRADTKEKSFPVKVKKKIAERDSIDGWPCCVNCGKPAPTELAFSNAHYISRAQGGLGIVENGLTLCPVCHGMYDQSHIRENMREYFRSYLRKRHPEWDEKNLVFRKDG